MVRQQSFFSILVRNLVFRKQLEPSEWDQSFRIEFDFDELLASEPFLDIWHPAALDPFDEPNGDFNGDGGGGGAIGSLADDEFEIDPFLCPLPSQK